MPSMYLYALAVLMSVSYIGLYYAFPFFVRDPLPRVTRRQGFVCLAFLAAAGILFYLSTMVGDLWWGNRFLHAIGGGFLATIICAVAARDSRASLTYLQWLILTILIVIALGVANELTELALETITGEIYAPTTTDTQLDLLSNLLGTLLGLVVTWPWLRRTFVSSRA